MNLVNASAFLNIVLKLCLIKCINNKVMQSNNVYVDFCSIIYLLSIKDPFAISNHKFVLKTKKHSH